MSEAPSIPPEVAQKLESVTRKDEKELLSKLDGWYKDCVEQRRQFERQWLLNMAFYFGRQWVQWYGARTASNTLYVPKAPPWRVRLVSNKIKPIIRRELSKLNQEQPQTFVIPASTEDQDMLAAKAGENVFEHVMREIKFNKTRRRTIFWMILTGSGFMKDSCSPEGEIKVESVSPFHLYVPNVQEEDLESQPYVIHTVAKDLLTVKSMFPDYADKLTANATSIGSIDEQRYYKALNLKNPPKKLVQIKECWVKPNADYPDGLIVQWTDGQILSTSEEWLYEYKEYPFTKFDHVPTGKFYGDSVIPDLIPLQKEYNRTRSQVIEAKNRMSKPQLVAPRGSVDPKKITSEPGLIVFYTPGFTPPTPLPLQSLPSYVLEEVDRNQRDMDDISSQHEVTQGRTPPGVEAATAISYLQEQDDSVLAPSISSIEEGIEKIGQHILHHVKQFWNEEKLIKVVGTDGIYEAFTLSNADLHGNTDLRVESGSATPRSKAAKQAFIMQLGENGWLPPQLVLRYLEMGEAGRLYEEVQLDARQAQRENLRMSTGEQVPVNRWDSHEIHIAEHNNFRKRQQYEHLPEEVQIFFEQHVMMHEMALAGQPPQMGAPQGAQGGEEPPQEAGPQPGPQPPTM